MNYLLLTCSVVVLCVASCGGQRDQAQDVSINLPNKVYRCQSYGGFSEDVCLISFFRLAAVPSDYAGRIVGVHGYVAKIDDRYYIFNSKESYESENLANSLECRSNLGGLDKCKDLEALVGKNVVVAGRFSDSIPIGDWVIRPIGIISLTKVLFPTGQ